MLSQFIANPRGGENLSVHDFFSRAQALHDYCRFSHDVTKVQTTKLSILPGFDFHDVLEQLKTNFDTNFRFKRVLGFVIEYA